MTRMFLLQSDGMSSISKPRVPEAQHVWSRQLNVRQPNHPTYRHGPGPRRVIDEVKVKFATTNAGYGFILSDSHWPGSGAERLD